MTRRLPPLNALRAFEAAARHQSFSRAADEMAVTPAAISHQVKALEDQLQIRLFRRLPRGLVLTDEGRALLPGISDGFLRLADAVGRVCNRDLAGRLRVSVIPSFAARWLVPRIGDFHARYPEIDLEIEAEARSIDLNTSDADIGIRYGSGDYPGLATELLLREELFPVCSPTLLNRGPPLKEMADLRHHVLLHDIYAPGWLNWQSWLEDAGVRDIDLNRGLRFSDTAMIIQAAIAGHGLAIGRSGLMGKDLDAGRLVRPMPVSRPAPYDYWMVVLPHRAEEPRLLVFRQWLAEQAAAPPAQSAPGGRASAPEGS